MLEGRANAAMVNDLLTNRYAALTTDPDRVRYLRYAEDIIRQVATSVSEVNSTWVND